MANSTVKPTDLPEGGLQEIYFYRLDIEILRRTLGISDKTPKAQKTNVKFDELTFVMDYVIMAEYEWYLYLFSKSVMDELDMWKNEIVDTTEFKRCYRNDDQRGWLEDFTFGTYLEEEYSKDPRLMSKWSQNVYIDNSLLAPSWLTWAASLDRNEEGFITSDSVVAGELMKELVVEYYMGRDCNTCGGHSRH